MALYKLADQSPIIEDEKVTFIAPSSDIIGKVKLAAGANIWFGAVLRGDLEWIEIGERTNIQDLSVLHTDLRYPTIIKEGCTIGHSVIVHGAFIDSYSLIGMGAVILNGARIGKECLVGAGSLVTQNKTFPDRSLIVGSPAKAVRTLTDEEVEQLYISAENYYQNGLKFLQGMQPIDKLDKILP